MALHRRGRYGAEDLSCKIYIGGLGSGADPHEIQGALESCGRLRGPVWIARNPAGFAFAEFETSDDARRAVELLDGTKMNGRRVRVELSSGKSRWAKWNLTPPAPRLAVSGPGSQQVMVNLKEIQFLSSQSKLLGEFSSWQERNSPPRYLRTRSRSPFYRTRRSESDQRKLSSRSRSDRRCSTRSRSRSDSVESLHYRRDFTKCRSLSSSQQSSSQTRSRSSRLSNSSSRSESDRNGYSSNDNEGNKYRSEVFKSSNSRPNSQQSFRQKRSNNGRSYSFNSEIDEDRYLSAVSVSNNSLRHGRNKGGKLPPYVASSNRTGQSNNRFNYTESHNSLSFRDEANRVRRESRSSSSSSDERGKFGKEQECRTRSPRSMSGSGFDYSLRKRSESGRGLDFKLRDGSGYGLDNTCRSKSRYRLKSCESSNSGKSTSRTSVSFCRYIARRQRKRRQKLSRSTTHSCGSISRYKAEKGVGQEIRIDAVEKKYSSNKWQQKKRTRLSSFSSQSSDCSSRSKSSDSISSSYTSRSSSKSSSRSSSFKSSDRRNISSWHRSTNSTKSSSSDSNNSRHRKCPPEKKGTEVRTQIKVEV